MDIDEMDAETVSIALEKRSRGVREKGKIGRKIYDACKHR